MLLQSRTITVTEFGELHTTANGNVYLECHFEEGVLGVWGQQHCQELQTQALPFTLRAKCLTDRQEDGWLWVPERATLKILPMLPPSGMLPLVAPNI